MTRTQSLYLKRGDMPDELSGCTVLTELTKCIGHTGAGIQLRLHWQAAENLDCGLRRNDEKKSRHRTDYFQTSIIKSRRANSHGPR